MKDIFPLDEFVPQKLVAHCERYGFFWTVRELLRAYRRRALAAQRHLETSTTHSSEADSNHAANIKHLATMQPGNFVPPTQEHFVFRGNNSLAFQANEVSSIDIRGTSGANRIEQAQIDLSFFVLTGSQGILPLHYSELAQKTKRDKNDALEAFFNLFNHRTISLLHKSTCHFDFSFQQELTAVESEFRSQLNHVPSRAVDGLALATDQLSPLNPLLFSLTGLSAVANRNRSGVDDESLVYYSGLLGLQHRPVSALRQVIADYFEVPVTIDEFRGSWSQLIDEVRTSLGSMTQRRGTNSQLGCTAILGEKAFTLQSRIGITLGPVDAETFERFRPGSKALKELEGLIHYYFGNEIQCDVQIDIDRAARPASVCLGKSFSIGWNAWLYESLGPGPGKHVAQSKTRGCGADRHADEPDQSLRIRLPIRSIH